ncbi:MAG: TolC family protein [Bacteroidota bacterium]|nr:TolC family protein [Bacteroidota bacterium]
MALLPASAQSNYNLQKALQTAKVNNPVLKTEIFNLSIAEADIVTAKLRPNIVLNNQSLQLLQTSLFPENTTWANGKNRQVWWQLTKQFQLPSQRRYRIDFAKQNVSLSQKEYSETERNLFLDVAIKWLDVWTTRKQLDILIIAKSNTDSLVVTNKLRLKNQVITQTDLSRTELLSNQYALQINSSEQNYKNEIANLKLLVGVQDNLNIDTTDNFIYVFPDNIDSLLQQGLTLRSDILTLKSAIDVSNSNIKLQKSLAWPTPELGVIYNPQNTVPYAGVFATIQIPIFSRNQGEIQKSNLIKQQAEQELNSTQKQIQTEISTAYDTYKTEKQNLSKYKGIIKQSEDILNNVKYSYLRGGTTIIDFLEAQRSWLDTQQQYYETIQQYKQSYIKLLYASGLINKLAQ